jgi:hypothetical protein
MPRNISNRTGATGRKDKRTGTVVPTEMDYARLAAYIDGEGCISMSVSRKKEWKHDTISVFLSVHNTDPRLITWCLERWGGRVYKTEQSNKKWSDSYGWRVTCQQARAILESCLPFFILKREQAELAIALQKTCKYWGSAGAPEEVHILRWNLRKQLSALKGRNARLKYDQPEKIDYVNVLQ